MAHTRKLNSNNLVCNVKEVLLTHNKQGNRLIIALSGGIDSVVLLHILSTLAKQLPFKLSAVHVNHGISINAHLWSEFCCNLCYALGVPIHVAYLQIRKESGKSLEAIARDERYRIFSGLYADYVVQAHHLDDQVETLLLQLLRGAGIRGLSAMPVVRKQNFAHAPKILRPLLEVSRSVIESYAQQNNLKWMNDESNDSIRFDRNFLRHEILPIIKKRYPNCTQTLFRSSRHLAEASSLLNELAEMDSSSCLYAGELQIEGLRKLSFARAKNLFRNILIKRGADLPSTVKLEEILKQLLSLSADNNFHFSFGNTDIRSFKGAVMILPRREILEGAEYYQYSWNEEAFSSLRCLNGTIDFIQVENLGISQQKLLNQKITIRLRQGGERFMPVCNRPRRSLKKILQEASIPPWERSVMPLLFCDDKLVWVPGIGIDCEFQVKSGESGVLPIWNPS